MSYAGIDHFKRVHWVLTTVGWSVNAAIFALFAAWQSALAASMLHT